LTGARADSWRADGPGAAESAGRRAPAEAMNAVRQRRAAPVCGYGGIGRRAGFRYRHLCERL